MKDKRIIFMGTASFSLEVLKMLICEKYNIVAVVTQPDRYVGRKKILTMPDVKVEALEHNIPVLQPAKIKEDYQGILDLNPDLIISAAYGQIVPRVLLETPPLGAINVHASLLPLYRGGAPVHKCIIEGQKETGVTIMYMDVKMDAGDMISKVTTPILDEDTVGSLYDRLSILGAELLKATLPSVLDGTNPRTPQDESQITFAKTLSREDERLNFNQTALQVFNHVRGMNPWPGAYTTYQGKVVKIWAGKVHHCENAVKHHAHQTNGTIVKIFNDAIGVKVSDGVYIITEFQIEGKKRMMVKDYLRGNNIFEVNTYFE